MSDESNLYLLLKEIWSGGSFALGSRTGGEKGSCYRGSGKGQESQLGKKQKNHIFFFTFGIKIVSWLWKFEFYISFGFMNEIQSNYLFASGLLTAGVHRSPRGFSY